MKRIILLGCILVFCGNLYAQRIKTDCSAIPLSINLDDNNIRSLALNLGFYYPIKKTDCSVGLKFREIYNLDKEKDTYQQTSSVGISLGYVCFKGNKDTFWEDSKIETLFDVGYGFLAKHKDEDFVYTDISGRIYLHDLVFLGLGYNHKFGIDIAHSNLYLCIGFRI